MVWKMFIQERLLMSRGSNEILEGRGGVADRIQVDQVFLPFAANVESDELAGVNAGGYVSSLLELEDCLVIYLGRSSEPSSLVAPSVGMAIVFREEWSTDSGGLGFAILAGFFFCACGALVDKGAVAASVSDELDNSTTSCKRLIEFCKPWDPASYTQTPVSKVEYEPYA